MISLANDWDLEEENSSLSVVWTILMILRLANLVKLVFWWVTLWITFNILDHFDFPSPHVFPTVLFLAKHLFPL